MNRKYYSFRFHDGDLIKEVSKFADNHLTFDEVRSMFYDYCAAIGYPVQKEWEYLGEKDTTQIQGLLKDVE